MPRSYPAEWRDPSDQDILDAAADIAADRWTQSLGPDVEVILRDPDMRAIEDERLAFRLHYWHNVRAERGDGRFPPGAVRPEALVPILGHLMVLDVERGGMDARYRLYGSRIAEHAGKDWTGYLVSEMNRLTRTTLAVAYRAIYAHVHATGEAVFTRNVSPPWLVATSWWRLILPVHGSDGAVVRFLVGNIPSGTPDITHEEWATIRGRLKS